LGKHCVRNECQEFIYPLMILSRKSFHCSFVVHRLEMGLDLFEDSTGVSQVSTICVCTEGDKTDSRSNQLQLPS